jgi:hypothetical protein
LTEKSEHAKIFTRQEVKNLETKNVSFELDPATHLKLKIKCVVEDIHIKDWVAELVKSRLEEEEAK